MRDKANQARLVKLWRAKHPDYNAQKMREYRSGDSTYGRVFVELLGVKVRADYLRVLRRIRGED